MATKTLHGCDDLWRTCYREHAPRLLLFARQWLSETADAEDAVQTAFVRFWRRHPGGSREDVPLLYAAVKSAALDVLRSRNRRKSREDAVAGDWGSHVEPCWFDSSLESREDARQVEAAVAKLPENQREVVVLRIWAGLTFAEIGKTTRQSLNTVAARYRYALNNLRKQLEYEHASS